MATFYNYFITINMPFRVLMINSINHTKSTKFLRISLKIVWNKIDVLNQNEI